MSNARHIAVSVITRTVVCIVILGVSAAVFLVLVRTRPTAVVVDRTGDLPRVVVVAPQVVPVRREWSGYGTATAMDETDVPARVVATVSEVPADVLAGAAVSRGQLLARLDESDFIRQVEIASQAIAELSAQLAQLDVEEASWTERLRLAADDVVLAGRDMERVEQAMASEAAKERELDRARQALVAAKRQEVATREEVAKVAPRRLRIEALRAQQEASLLLARLNAGRCRIESPMEGILQSVDVDEGENVQAGQRVARVVSVARMEVPLRLPAGARPFIAPGDEVSLRADDGRAGGWTAVVSRIAPEDDEATRTFGVYVVLLQEPRAKNLLAPGRFVQGRVRSSEAVLRTLVPRRAVTGERVLVVEDGVLGERRVAVEFLHEGRLPQSGLDDPEWIVLEGELPPGAAVVVNASSHLPIGSRVIPVPPETAHDGGVIEQASRPAEAPPT